MPDDPNVGSSAQEHLVAQGCCSHSPHKRRHADYQPTGAQLDDAVKNSLPASDPIATTSQKSTGT
jgi:hypothetical protein